LVLHAACNPMFRQIARHCWGLGGRWRIAGERWCHDGAAAELNRSGRWKSHSWNADVQEREHVDLFFKLKRRSVKGSIINWKYMYFKLPNLIKKARNVIRAYKQRLESYLEENNVRSFIIEKPVVWSPIITIFSLGLACNWGPI
jgi:hypothetical protein